MMCAAEAALAVPLSDVDVGQPVSDLECPEPEGESFSFFPYLDNSQAQALF
jgi:hypothetical protein